MKRSSVVAAAGAALLARATLPTSAQTLPTVRVGGTPNDDMTPIVYAFDSGMFAKAGLGVVIQKSTSGSAAAVAVAAGATDIAKSSINSIFDAHEKGVPFTILTPSVMYDTRKPRSGGFLLPLNSPIKSGKDLNGQTVAVAALGSIGKVAILGWAEQHGGDPSSIKFVEIPFTAVPSALEAGRIVAGETADPVRADAMATGRFAFLPAYDSIGTFFVGAVVYTTRGYSEAHPEIVKTFCRVFYEAARFTNAHPEATVKMMADYTGVASDVIAKMVRVTAGTELVPAQIQPAIDASAKYGTLKKAFPAREIIDPNAPVR
jgi:NitT/TauT family transport system substrate-binding protein